MDSRQTGPRGHNAPYQKLEARIPGRLCAKTAVFFCYAPRKRLIHKRHVPEFTGLASLLRNWLRELAIPGEPCAGGSRFWLLACGISPGLALRHRLGPNRGVQGPPTASTPQRALTWLSSGTDGSSTGPRRGVPRPARLTCAVLQYRCPSAHHNATSQGEGTSAEVRRLQP